MADGADDDPRLVSHVGLRPRHGPAPAPPPAVVAGSLAGKRSAPLGDNSFPTHGPLFVSLLTLVILLVGGLTFLPALALGPIAEHFGLVQGL